MNLDLSQFEPINEMNKDEVFAWLEDVLDEISDPNFAGRASRKVTRIFNTDKDDIDELITLLGRFAATINEYNFFKK